MAAYEIDMEFLVDVLRAVEQQQEVTIELRTERYERMVVRALLSRSNSKLDNADTLWVVDWKGRRESEPMAIKILEVLE